MKKISDTERFDWMIEHGAQIYQFHGAFRVAVGNRWLSDWKDTAREAMDSAMKPNVELTGSPAFA